MLNDLASMLSATLEIVRSAGKIIAEHNEKPRNIKHKGPIDLVTETDLAVEAFLKEKLAPVCPEAIFMAEESYSGADLAVLGNGPVWVIDPVDGTSNFAHKLPFVATSVALWQAGEVFLGVVNTPLLNECFWAVRGAGAFCNGAPIKVSNTSEMQNAMVATGFPYTIARDADKITVLLNRVLKAAQGVRRCGAAAIDLAYLAAGRFDAYYENGLKAWDSAAGTLLVQESGGFVSRYDGSVYTPGDDDILACAGPDLHKAMQQLLKS